MPKTLLSGLLWPLRGITSSSGIFKMLPSKSLIHLVCYTSLISIAPPWRQGIADEMSFPSRKCPPSPPLGIAGIPLPHIYFLLFHGIQEESRDNLEYFRSSETRERIPSWYPPMCSTCLYPYSCLPTRHFWGTDVLWKDCSICSIQY